MKKSVYVLWTMFALLFSGLSYALFAVKGNSIIAGQDYLVLPSPASNPKNKITVVEFFSYGCSACYRFDPALEAWRLRQPPYVDFQRVPVEFQPAWKSYARSYYAVEKLGIADKVSPTIFSAIHEQRMDLAAPTAMANFLKQTADIDPNAFLMAYQSSNAINTKVNQGREWIKTYMVYQVPGIVIDGKYKVDPSFAGSSSQRFIAIMDNLIAQEAQLKGLTTTHSSAVA